MASLTGQVALQTTPKMGSWQPDHLCCRSFPRKATPAFPPGLGRSSTTYMTPPASPAGSSSSKTPEWRRSASPPRPGTSAKPNLLRLKDVKVGDIVFIRKEEDMRDIDPTMLARSDLPSLSCDHPAVVLAIISRGPGQNTIEIGFMTSLDGNGTGKPLVERSPGVQRSLIPFVGCPQHPLADYPYLELEGGKQLRKNSYVKVNPTYRVDLRMLRPYQGSTPGTHRVTADSLAKLQKMVSHLAANSSRHFP